jgi:hypothetical protein
LPASIRKALESNGGLRGKPSDAVVDCRRKEMSW